MPIRILLTGSTGQVGGDLLPLLRSFADVIAPTRAELDLTHADAVRTFVRDLKPQWIVNPAAYTAVDRAEAEVAMAQAINEQLPALLAQEAARCGAALIHFSTDYVFDGSGTKPWNEDDLPNPLSVYGRTKLDGERAIAASGSAHLILRTSWVFGARGKNFLRTILHLAASREELRIVADQCGAPTWSLDLARATEALILQTEQEANARNTSSAHVLSSRAGIYHVAATGETTWFAFAEEILRIAGLSRPDVRFARLVPITTEDYPTPAPRPLNSRLDCRRFAETFGLTLPDWKESTSRVMMGALHDAL